MGFPDTDAFLNVTNPPEEQMLLFEDWLVTSNSMPGCKLETASLAAGVLSPSKAYVSARTEASATTDTLTHISHQNSSVYLLELRAGGGSETITVTDEAGGDGQIHLADGTDRDLKYGEVIRLYKEGDDWYERPVNVGYEAEPRGKNLAYNPLFTIDQIKQLTYVDQEFGSGVYCLDCWQTIVTTPTKGLFRKYSNPSGPDQPRCAAQASESGVIGWQQRNPNFKQFAGQEMTAGIRIYGSGTVRLVIQDGVTANYSTATINGNGVLYKTVPISSEATEFRVQVYLLSPSAGDWFRISQAKYELGKTFTPVEPVDYGEELARCQRFFRRQPFDSIGGFARTDTEGWMGIVFPEMYATPAVSLDDTIYAFTNYTGGGSFSDPTIISNMSRKTGLRIRIDGGTGMVAGDALMGSSSSDILLDANMY